MNQPIARLFVVVLIMFALLVAFTSRWSVFDQSALRTNPENRRPFLESLTVPRGSIVADNGAVIARSVRQRDGRYLREYPFHDLFASPVGYYDATNGSTGVERERNGVLAGAPPQQSSILDQLQDRQTDGDQVTTTLDPHAQQVALAGLAGRQGAVVAMVPSTGAIRVLVSSPSYDPNQIKDHAAFERLIHDSSDPLFNNATQAQYAPGSTFKVVDTIAAIDTNLYTPNSIINGNSPITVATRPLANDSGTSYGPVPLSYALTNSINTVYAQVALKVGAPTLQRYMQRLGFYRTPPIDLPGNELSSSGVRYPGHAGYLPLTGGADVGRVGIGEGGLEATPLQMVMVAAAVANGGRLMTPYLTREVVNADGQVVEETQPKLYSTVMKPSTAQTVGVMMENVVKDGTGTAAALAGVTVAGKTGTAQDCANLALPACQLNQVWFIAYAPVENPKIAVAVTLPHQNGFGGTIAAPIAREVIQALVGAHA
ncbi:MAG: peptidoglycan D,D-transpeptidase FtsI family protein [Solirubrobacteraceae bacterium]